MKKEILSCQNLAIGYKQALRSNLSFDLNEGEVTFIQGKNGSGKSTLIKTILGEIDALDGSFRWNIPQKNISYLPQITNSEAHFSYTIGEILDIYEVSPQHQSFVDPKLLTQNWTKSSGGEKQKTMILSKIKEDTKLLILDEPFNHLDSESINLIGKLLSSLIKTKTIASLLLVSHLKIDIGGFKPREIVL